MLATCHHSRITCILGSSLKAESKNRLKSFVMFAGTPKAEGGPGDSSNITHSGFVQYKTGKENGTLFFGFSSDLKKKVSPKLRRRFFCPNSGDLQKKEKGLSVQVQVISKNKNKRSSVLHFDGPYEAHWALS